MENLIVESEHIIKTSGLPNKEGIKYHIHKILDINCQKHLNKNSKQNKNIKPLINKIKDNNLTINKADKCNVLTIQNKNTLLEKTIDFLNNPIYLKSKNDPTARYQKDVKQVLKQSNLIISENNKNFIINPNPSVPKLRASTKIHKENNPIRPIVNYRTAPAYNLKKILNNILKTNLILENRYNIKNSVELTKN